jgi:hypothetical protein
MIIAARDLELKVAEFKRNQKRKTAIYIHIQELSTLQTS